MVINIIVPIMILIIAVAITPSIVTSIILDPGNREGCAAVQAGCQWIRAYEPLGQRQAVKV